MRMSYKTYSVRVTWLNGVQTIACGDLNKAEGYFWANWYATHVVVKGVDLLEETHSSNVIKTYGKR